MPPKTPELPYLSEGGNNGSPFRRLITRTPVSPAPPPTCAPSSKPVQVKTGGGGGGGGSGSAAKVDVPVRTKPAVAPARRRKNFRCMESFPPSFGFLVGDRRSLLFIPSRFHDTSRNTGWNR